MKITSLVIKNFLAIGHAELALDEKGLVLLQGQNLDDTSANSNGAGKSSLADSIFWSLYGETAREKLSADGVVNNKVGKDCQVTVIIEEDSGSKAVISRWRKKNVNGKRAGCSLVYDGVDLTKGTDRLTQIEIDRVLGCSKEVFTKAVYAGQEALPNLPAMTDTELKTLIEEASGIDMLVRAYKIARDKLNEAERAHDTWRANYARTEREVTDSNTRLVDMTLRKGTFEKKRAQDLGLLAQALRDTVVKARAKKQERDDIEPMAIQRRIDLLDTKIAAVHEEQEEESRLSVLASEAAAHFASVNATYNRAAEDARTQARKLQTITDQIGKPCDECGKPYEACDMAAARGIAQDNVQRLVAKAREIKEDATEREKIKDSASKKLAEYRSARTDIQTTVDERTRLATVLATRKRAEDAFATETANATRIKTQHDDLKVAVNPFIDLVEKAEDEFNEAARVHREAEELGVELETRVRVCKDVVKVYGPAGVRAHILDTVTPYLNDRTATYLGIMSDGRINAVWSTISLNAKGEVTENFTINVAKEGAADSFAGLSGGEKRKVRLSCALALQDLVASRATKPIGLFIGDELDDALDAAGLERLMTVLTQKARERGTVLVISHSDIRDWITNVCTLTMEDGISTVDAGVLAPV